MVVPGHVFADAGDRGTRVANATSTGSEVVTGPPNQRVFIVRKRRWEVERTFPWIGNRLRLTKDYGCKATISLGFLILAAAMIRVKRCGVGKQ